MSEPDEPRFSRPKVKITSSDPSVDWSREEKEEEEFGLQDVKVEVTIRFTTGIGGMDEMTQTMSLPGLLKPENLESSEARVAEAIGLELIEPIRARMRAEILCHFGQLPEPWLEDDPILIDWYKHIKLSGTRRGRMEDMAQWFRMIQGSRALSRAIVATQEQGLVPGPQY